MFHPCFIEATVFSAWLLPATSHPWSFALDARVWPAPRGPNATSAWPQHFGPPSKNISYQDDIHFMYWCTDHTTNISSKNTSLRKSLEKLLYPPVTLKPASFWCRLGCGSSSWLTVHFSGFKWIGSSTCSALLFGCSPHGGKPKGWEILLRAKLTSSKETRLTGTVWNTCHTTLHGKCSEISVDF